MPKVRRWNVRIRKGRNGIFYPHLQFTHIWEKQTQCGKETPEAALEELRQRLSRLVKPDIVILCETKSKSSCSPQITPEPRKRKSTS